VSSRRTVSLAVVGLVVALVATMPARALERTDLRIAGQVKRLAAGHGRVWILVGGDADAPRQLLELQLAADGAKLVTRASGLSAKVDAIVAAPAAVGEGVALLVEGRAVTAVDAAHAGAPRTIYRGPGVLLGGSDGTTVATLPPWLAAGRAGEAWPLSPNGEELQAGPTAAVPVTASLERWGLHLTSPEARFAGPWLAVGPLQEGFQLRTVLIGADGRRQEHTSQLPEPERVAESTVVTLDGRPTLVTGTFRGLGLMSRKRLRVFALAGEPGAPPRRPMLARELDARAWQETSVRTGDFDGDGRDDLAIASAQGLTEGDAVVTLFRGMGGGRLRAEPVVASFSVKGVGWRYGGDVDGDKRPDFVTLGGNRLEVRPGMATNGLPAKKPSLTVKVEGTDVESRRTVAVGIGAKGAHAEEGKEAQPPAQEGSAKGGSSEEAPRLPPPDWQLVDVDGDGRDELLWWAAEPGGRESRLIVLKF